MKRKIQITGLVKLANYIRNEISRPISSKKLIQLQNEVDNSLKNIDKLLKQTGSRTEFLPAPSRKAYKFLKNIDFSKVSTQNTASAKNISPNSISFPGLSSHFNGILEHLSKTNVNLNKDEIFQNICSSSEHIEKEIQTQNFKPEHLKSQSRSIRGWLAYFSQRQNFDSYLAAIRRATPAFCETAMKVRKNALPVYINFLPVKVLYIARRYKNHILVKLPTPMICFDENTMKLLAEWIVNKANNKNHIIAASLSNPYQEILSELNMLGGIIDNTEGLHHNLAQSFNRVNSEYFNHSLECPSLAWNKTFTYRKFGHYDRTHDALVISMSLDRKDVPEYVIDFVMYHELLHKKIGSKWGKSNRISHTNEFYKYEKLFKQYEQSKTILNKLAHPFK